MGKHGNAQVKSPSCVLKSEILSLALVWKQDLTAALLVVPKLLHGLLMCCSEHVKIATHQGAARNVQILAFS